MDDQDSDPRQSSAAASAADETGSPPTPAEDAAAVGHGAAVSDLPDYLRFRLVMRLYTETTTLYRHFSGWRARLFVCYLATVAVIAAGYGWLRVQPGAEAAGWLAMGSGCVLTLVFWAVERRNREIIRAAAAAASRLESELHLDPKLCFYTRLRNLPGTAPAHGHTLDWMYLIAALSFLVATVYCLSQIL
ncbi:MAG: hypothetical protein KJ749_08055 [Planctomycetes bacterium]|nr:hypothetical protein [Planctomycetota bacterium]